MLSSNMAVGLRRLTWISRAVTRTMRVRDHHAIEPRIENIMGKTIMHNNVKRCLHKLILIAVAIEAAMLEDSMTSHENALYAPIPLPLPIPPSFHCTPIRPPSWIWRSMPPRWRREPWRRTPGSPPWRSSWPRRPRSSSRQRVNSRRWIALSLSVPEMDVRC